MVVIVTCAIEGHVFVAVSVCVCLRFCVRNISKSYARILTKFLKRLGARSPRNNRLDSGGDVDHDPDPAFLEPARDPHPGMFFEGFFILLPRFL